MFQLAYRGSWLSVSCRLSDRSWHGAHVGGCRGAHASLRRGAHVGGCCGAHVAFPRGAHVGARRGAHVAFPKVRLFLTTCLLATLTFISKHPQCCLNFCHMNGGEFSAAKVSSLLTVEALCPNFLATVVSELFLALQLFASRSLR